SVRHFLGAHHQFPAEVALFARKHQADERRDDVLDERIDDLAEGGADDDADGEIDDVAFQGEILEFFQQRKDSSGRLERNSVARTIHGALLLFAQGTSISNSAIITDGRCPSNDRVLVPRRQLTAKMVIPNNAALTAVGRRYLSEESHERHHSRLPASGRRYPTGIPLYGLCLHGEAGAHQTPRAAPANAFRNHRSAVRARGRRTERQ